MIELLSHIFIKNKDKMSPSDLRRAYGILSSLVGIGLNILLFAGKYLAGQLSASIAITADAFNNLSDAGSSLITLLGFKLAGKAPDSDHPYGHGRIEYLSGLAVAVAIIMMGIELIRSSIDKIINPEPVDSSLLIIVILLASIAVKLYMAFYNNKYGKKLDSAGMRATAIDSLSDSAATSVVLLATLIARFTDFNVDGWCGVLVALFIIYAGINAVKETLYPLLGQAPDPEFIENIEQIVMAHPEVVGIHDLLVHDYGPGRCMISLHAEVPGNGDIYVLHDAIDCIEHELKEKLGCEAVIHMDPIAVDDKDIMSHRAELEELMKEKLPGVSIHDFRMVVGNTHTNLIFDAVVPYELNRNDAEAREMICRVVTAHWQNYFAVVNIDRPYTKLNG